MSNKDRNPRKAKVVLAALNIVLPEPHTPEHYARAFVDRVSTFKGYAKLRGDVYGTIHTAFPITNDQPEMGIEGEMLCFMQISLDEPWFNLQNAEAASKTDLQAINIPEHLRPKLRRIRYVFYPHSHRLVYIQHHKFDRISPQMAAKLVALTLNSSGIADQAEVTIEQSQETLDRIQAMSVIRRLEITVKRPNPDDMANIEALVFGDMQSQNVACSYHRLDAEPGKSLKPSDQNMRLARVAVSNGVVQAVGQDENGKPVTENTEDHPRLLAHTVNFAKVSIVEWLRGAAQDFIEKIKQ